MDSKKLFYLAAVVEHGGFRSASRHLDVSQPALSKAVDRLERELGVKLLERCPGGVVTTSMGEVLYSHAKTICEDVASATERMNSEPGLGFGVIRFGTLPTLASSVVPLALARCAAAAGMSELRIVEKGQAELLVGLMKGEFDFIIGLDRYCGRIEGLKQQVLFRDQKFVCAGATHPLLREKAPTWSDLTAFPWVCPMVGPIWTLLETILAARGLPPPRHVARATSVEFARQMVLGSTYLTIMPPHAVAADLSSGRIKTLPITVPQLSRNVALIFREQFPLDAPRQDLVRYIQAAGVELSRPA